jgi:hypothetical protein
VATEKLPIARKDASPRIGRAEERVDRVEVEGAVVVRKARKPKANHASLAEPRHAGLLAMSKKVVLSPTSLKMISMTMTHWMTWVVILKATTSRTMS